MDFKCRIRNGKEMIYIDSFYDIYNIGIKDPDMLDDIDEERVFRKMRSTGIEDKNGKDIREGDIVRVESRIADAFKLPYPLGEVIFTRGCFFVGDSSKGNFDFLLDMNGIMRGEVIGNIHENKDLLNDR